MHLKKDEDRKKNQTEDSRKKSRERGNDSHTDVEPLTKTKFRVSI